MKSFSERSSRDIKSEVRHAIQFSCEVRDINFVIAPIPGRDMVQAYTSCQPTDSNGLIEEISASLAEIGWEVYSWETGYPDGTLLALTRIADKGDWNKALNAVD